MCNLNDPQVARAMKSMRSSQIGRIRTHASDIFGPGFKSKWFRTKFDRGSIPKLQDLLGAHMTTKGKEYTAIPPILFPEDSVGKKSEIFLNPVLFKVSTFLDWASTTQHTDAA